MARPLRIEGAGFWYHVICRGNGGQHVFADTRDREAFLQRTGALAPVFHVEIHAYALMHTHMHLFVRTRKANLGRFMQRLLSGYTQWFNVRHHTCGHLFQGRYKAFLVDKNAYGAEVSRYIHLNPVRTGGTTKEAVARQQAALREYRWSSYRAMMGTAPRDEWLVTKDTLARWGTGMAGQRKNYARFVEEGLAGELADPAEEAEVPSILGRDRFIDRVRRLLHGRKAGDRESERTRHQLTAENIETVMRRVARAYKTTPLALKKPGTGGRSSEARRVALWLARERCSACCSLAEIGKAMGVGKSAVNMACRRVASSAKRDKHLKRMLDKLS